MTSDLAVVKEAIQLDITNDDFVGDARLFKLNPPLAYTSYEEVDGEYQEVGKEAHFVIVSAASVIGSGPETYIFPSNKEGNILNWGELEGSRQGDLDHEAALERAGYNVVSVIDIEEA